MCYIQFNKNEYRKKHDILPILSVIRFFFQQIYALSFGRPRMRAMKIKISREKMKEQKKIGIVEEMNLVQKMHVCMEKGIDIERKKTRRLSYEAALYIYLFIWCQK